jgi:SAM-dependent methyltransferase
LLAALPLPQGADGSALVYPVGYGIEAAWLAEAVPGVRLVGGDPDAEKVRVATRVAGPGGCIRKGAIDALQGEKDITILFLTGRPLRSAAPEALLSAACGHLAPGGEVLVLAGTGDAPVSWISRLWNRIFPGPEPYDVEDVRTFFTREGFRHIQENRVGRQPYLVWLRAVKT